MMHQGPNPKPTPQRPAHHVKKYKTRKPTVALATTATAIATNATHQTTTQRPPNAIPPSNVKNKTTRDGRTA